MDNRNAHGKNPSRNIKVVAMMNIRPMNRNTYAFPNRNRRLSTLFVRLMKHMLPTPLLFHPHLESHALILHSTPFPMFTCIWVVGQWYWISGLASFDMRRLTIPT